MRTFNSFSKLYPLSKTLRFSLEPIGKTLDHIVASGILEQDQHRAASYLEVKKIIDNYHKAFIERVLADFSLKTDDNNQYDSLKEFYFFYQIKQKDESQKKRFKEIQGKLRSQIAAKLSKDPAFKRIDKKELIREDLLNFATDENERNLIMEFKEFTSYFTGFFENRKNMYTAEEKSTAIAYRLINENLPRFLDNEKIFAELSNTELISTVVTLNQKNSDLLNGYKIEDIFKIDFFNNVLTQSQIASYNYIIGQINSLINEYNQTHAKTERIAKLKVLYKQILADREVIAWLPESFNNDNDVLEAIQKFYEEWNTSISPDSDTPSLKNILTNLHQYDLDRIFIRNDQQLTNISNRLFGNWAMIEILMIEELKKTIGRKNKKETDESYNERLSKIMKNFNSFSIAQINLCTAAHDKRVESYFSEFGNTAYGDIFENITSAYNTAKELLNTTYPAEKNLVQDKHSIEILKNLLDSIKSLQNFIKPLMGYGDEPDKDERFYGDFSPIWNKMLEFNKLYDMVRNYVTKKPYSIEKIKLNFENATLLNGWDLNKERDNTSVILEKDGLYYLAIMNKKHNKILDANILPDDGECFRKMEYKFTSGAKMLYKVFLSEKGIKKFKPSEKVMDIYKTGKFKKGNNFNREDCQTLIDYFKESINNHKEWNVFDFNFSDTHSYSDISGFSREFEQQGYKLSFRNVSIEYINELVESGKLYLFQIYNKDFAQFSKGTPNLHTLYWKMLFDERNLKDVVYKLNGDAEVFYRKKSISYEKPTHPANIPIKNKYFIQKRETRILPYDLIKDKRYTVDKFLFHVPITLNFKCADRYDINPAVNNYIRNNSNDLHIIGIDRGERHLLYISVINTKGEIVEQFSLNEIEHNSVYKTNYKSLLEKREHELEKSRKSWQTVESIKELKEGYLSQAIHIITQLMIKYNAIIAMEDLNIGFKRLRQKVDRQVYQKFEKMLIDKLNYLVDKKKEAEEDGGLLNAYQLTNKFESFSKIGKQNGFIFYVPAWNTSKIDPTTGFVNLFSIDYESVEKSKNFFTKFERIRYNKSQDIFEFDFDYNKFTTKADGSRTKWTINTYGARIINFRDPSINNNWNTKEICLTGEFKALFNEYNIKYEDDLKCAIINQDKADFYKKLIHLLKAMLQVRNSDADKDYIISPAVGENGYNFNTENMGTGFPENADANGAYNIALKGLWAIRQIAGSIDDKSLKLSISNKEWLKFAQEKPFKNN